MSTTPQFTINRETHQAQYFREDLGDGIKLNMILIPNGRFIMGAPVHEEQSLDRERPQHQVTISSFLIGQYPITQAQWRQVASIPQVSREMNPDPSRFKGGDRPVEGITWDHAIEFCERLSQHTNRPYRLPTEAEWEYACRAGTMTPFHFGETISTDLANYQGTDWEYKGKTYPGNYGRGSKGIYREETTPVGSFKVANRFGLYDMHGNVWEWCGDEWHENYEDAPTDGTAWTDKNDENSSKRVLRGGSWVGYPNACRSAFRTRIEPDGYYHDVGLRVACSASKTV